MKNKNNEVIVLLSVLSILAFQPKLNADGQREGAWLGGKVDTVTQTGGKQTGRVGPVGDKSRTMQTSAELSEAKVQQAIRELFTESRWIVMPDGTIEVRPAQAKHYAGRLKGTHKNGSFTGRGRWNEGSPVGCHQEISGKITPTGTDTATLEADFSCQLGSGIALKNLGMSHATELRGHFTLPLMRGIHKPGQGNALVFASAPVSINQLPQQRRQSSYGGIDQALDEQFYQTLQDIDFAVASKEAQQRLNGGWWEFYPDQTFRFVPEYDGAPFLCEVVGTWKYAWNQDVRCMRYEANLNFEDSSSRCIGQLAGSAILQEGRVSNGGVFFIKREGMNGGKCGFLQIPRLDQAMQE